MQCDHFPSLSLSKNCMCSLFHNTWAQLHTRAHTHMCIVVYGYVRMPKYAVKFNKYRMTHKAMVLFYFCNICLYFVYPVLYLGILTLRRITW